MKNLITSIKNLWQENNFLCTVIGLIIIITIIGIINIGVKILIITIPLVAALIFHYFRGDIMKIFKKNKTQTPKTKKTTKKKLNTVLLILLIIGIVCLALMTIFLVYIVFTAPDFNPDNLYKKEASVLYDSDNQEITKLGREKREKISYDDLPEVLINAIIATEDSRFFQHNGLDLPRFLKASIGQLMGNKNAGGGSTLSMQVIKNNFTSKDQTIVRKFTDVYMAIFKLEKKYTKKQIIEFYVNIPYLGSGSYGVEQASLTYFNKSVKDLTLSEAAIIAGLFQAPGSYDPYVYPEKAEERRKTVLYLMNKHGYISKEEQETAAAIPVNDLLKGKRSNSTDTEYQGFIDTVVEEVIEKTGQNPYNIPMEIYTTMNRQKQDVINAVLKGEYTAFENDKVQVGLTMTDINTGAILAIGAGRNRDGERSYNFATMSSRQPGSSAKPIFDYGPGMEYSNFSTYTPFVDEPYTYKDGTPINNWDNNYNGWMTSRVALATSRNIPALKAFQKTKNSDILKFAQGLGIKPEIDKNSGKIHEAHAIGGFNGVSTVQMAGAYGAFGNGGYYIKPYSVNKVILTDTNDTLEYKAKKTRAMSDSTAYMITDILKYAVNSGSVTGKINGVEIAGKTGTTNFDDATKKAFNIPSGAVNDLWLIAYSPDYTVSMWYGYEKNNGPYYNYVSTTTVRNRFYNSFASKLFDKNGKTFVQPASVVASKVEKGTDPATLPSEHTPDDMILTELFKKGTEPTEISTRYDSLKDVKELTAKLNSDKKSITLTWKASTNPVDQAKGNLQYNIYTKDKDGNVRNIDTTESLSYKYFEDQEITEDITFIVKVSYANNKSNQSPGVSVTVKAEVSYTYTTNLNGGDIIVPTGGTYTEFDPPFTILKNGVTVTESATYTTVYKKNNVIIDKSEMTVPGTYKIEYIITAPLIKTLTRNVVIE